MPGPTTLESLSPRARALLDAGCADANSRAVALANEVPPNYAALCELEKAGFLFWQGAHPIINDRARAATGAPSELRLKVQAARATYGDRPKSNYTSRRSNEIIAMGIVMVPERESADSWCASCDGDSTKAIIIPKSQVEIRLTEQFGFCAVLLPAWVAIDRKMAQASRPVLTTNIRWSPEQRAAWRRVQSKLTTLRSEIDRRRRWRTYDKLPFGYTA